MSLLKLLPLAVAAEKIGVSEDELRTQIEVGTIQAGILPNGEIVVSENTLPTPPTPKEQLPEYKKHKHLKGVSIWISEAGRKYDVSTQTISQWASAGYIKKLGMDGNRVLVDEADMAYCAEIYHQRKGQGKWLFNRDGTPYRPRTGTLVRANVEPSA